MGSNARGWHIAFLVFAAILLSVPASRVVVRLFDVSGPLAEEAARLLPLTLATALFALVAPLRRRAMALLAPPIPPGRRHETTVVVLLSMLFGFAATGGIFAWAFVTTGPEGVERMLARASTPDEQWADAVSPFGIFWSIAIAGLVGPFIEELVFRGLLQGAWERRWGWVAATAMTSTVFGLYHPHFFVAFSMGVVLTCLYRRTGSLRASIACHVAGNLALWYPLLGRFVFPSREAAQGDPGTWAVQLLCLLIALLLVPTYVVIAAIRPHEAHTPTEILERQRA